MYATDEPKARFVSLSSPYLPPNASLPASSLSYDGHYLVKIRMALVIYNVCAHSHLTGEWRIGQYTALSIIISL